MSQQAPVILWFRQDLRLQDNPALQAALESGRPIVPVFCYSSTSEGIWPLGEASRWWLHHALLDLKQQITDLGNQLLILPEAPVEALPRLAQILGAEAVLCNARVEPSARAEEETLKDRLQQTQTSLHSYWGNVLFAPPTVSNQSGQPFKVFTAFWKHCLMRGLPNACVSKPSHLPALPHGALSNISHRSVDDLGLLPRISWDSGFYEAWQPTRAGAQALITQFAQGPIAAYQADRDRPAVVGTSKLSPYLHWGQIGPRELVTQFAAVPGPGAQTYLKEVGWREFSHHLLYHFAHTPTEPLRPEFKAFPWEDNPQALKAWQQGLTGYPIVDAGMRQLWHTGWMHNRVRMIVASFLVKDLQISWQAGAQWFWDTLVDADLAANTQGWQWTAGCGADAAPYFRVFNPILQGEKFDPEGDYVHRWCPELAKLPRAWIHKPWQAPPLVLHEAGVQLGHHYPQPIVDHGQARDAALVAFKSLKSPTTSAP